MTKYTVREKDSLWKIAKLFPVTVDEIAAANGLKGRQIHHIRVGQVLNIPDKQGEDPDTLLSVTFRGLDSTKFTPKCVKVCCAGKEESYLISDNAPLLVPVDDHAGGLEIWIETFDKQYEKVFHVDTVPIGKWKLSVDSRVVKSDGALQPKKGKPTESKERVQVALAHNAQLADGKTQDHQTRVERGEPTHGVAAIYTAKNLRLVPGNERYRQLIIAAAEKYGLTPQFLASTIGAEAKKTKDGAWIERSNADSPKLAQGLAQFFKPAWDEVFKDKKSLLYTECQTLSVDARMSKRLEAKYAIDGAASLAALNLDAFERSSGYSIAQMPEEDKAKLAYMLHHEGLLGVLRVLGKREQVDDDEMVARLQLQLGGNTKEAKKRLEALLQRYNRDPVAAYKGWLFNYVDANISVQTYVIKDDNKFAKPPKSIAAILQDLKPSLTVAKPKPKNKSTNTASPAIALQQNAKKKPEDVKAAKEPDIKGSPSVDLTSRWHDPLDVCTLRTAGLSGKKGAMFGWTRNGGKRCHQGIDLAANPGTPIYAVANGKVYTRPTTGDYGNVLILEVGINDLPETQAREFRRVNPNAQTIGFIYAHLSEMTKTNSTVNCGDVIGKTGCTGNAEKMTSIDLGAHLHFEVRLHARERVKGLGNRADPLPFIEKCTNR